MGGKRKVTRAVHLRHDMYPVNTEFGGLSGPHSPISLHLPACLAVGALSLSSISFLFDHFSLRPPFFKSSIIFCEFDRGKCFTGWVQLQLHLQFCNENDYYSWLKINQGTWRIGDGITSKCKYYISDLMAIAIDYIKLHKNNKNFFIFFFFLNDKNGN